MTGATLALGQKIEGLFTSQPADYHVQSWGQTVGQVAAYASVTKKTARKYLEMLREAGILDRHNHWYGNVGCVHVYRLSTKAYINHYSNGRGK